MAQNAQGAIKSSDIEKLRTWINSKIKDIIGFEDSTIVEVVVDGLKKQLPTTVLSQLLQQLLEDATTKFVEELFVEVAKVKERKSNSKRKIDDEISSESKEKDKKRQRDSSDHHKSKDRKEGSSSSSKDKDRRERSDKERYVMFCNLDP